MSEITLLDGSIGQELVKRAGKAPTPLWSTTVMIDQPEILRDVHAESPELGGNVDRGRHRFGPRTVDQYRVSIMAV